MKITDKVLETTDENVREMVVTIVASVEEVDKYIDDYFKELNENEVPGFRKGKAPRAVLENGVGGHKAAMGGAAEKMINALAFQAIDDEDVLYISDPEFNVETTLEEGKPFTFTVSGQVEPIMELSDYGPVTIEMPPDEPTENEIDHQIANLIDYYHTFETITDPDHGAEMGDYVQVRMTCSRCSDNRAIRGLSNVERLVGLGAGTMPASFDEYLLATKVGDMLEFDFDASGEKEHPEFGDGKLHAVVEILGFRKQITPDLDDEFAKKLGADDVPSLRRQVGQALMNDKRETLPAMMEERVVGALAERLVGDIPEYYLDFVRQDVTRELVRDMDDNGTNLQEWILNNNVKRDELKEKISTEADNRARRGMALDAFFFHEGWEVTQEDLEIECRGDEDPQATLDAWKTAARMADLRKISRQHKVVRWLIKTAEVVVVEELD